MLEVRERTLGPQHSNTLRAKANLADAACLRTIVGDKSGSSCCSGDYECGTGFFLGGPARNLFWGPVLHSVLYPRRGVGVL